MVTRMQLVPPEYHSKGIVILHVSFSFSSSFDDIDIDDLSSLKIDVDLSFKLNCVPVDEYEHYYYYHQQQVSYQMNFHSTECDQLNQKIIAQHLYINVWKNLVFKIKYLFYCVIIPLIKYIKYVNKYSHIVNFQMFIKLRYVCFLLRPFLPKYLKTNADAGDIELKHRLKIAQSCNIITLHSNDQN